MKKLHKFSVEGANYTVAPFDTSHGMVLLTEIILKLGEPLLQMAAVFTKDKDKKLAEMEIKPEAVSAIMMGLTARVDQHTLNDIFQRVLEGTSIDGTSFNCRQKYDEHFSGEYGKLFKVVFESLKGQYGSFLAGLGGLEKLVAMVKQAQ